MDFNPYPAKTLRDDNCSETSTTQGCQKLRNAWLTDVLGLLGRQKKLPNVHAISSVKALCQLCCDRVFTYLVNSYVVLFRARCLIAGAIKIKSIGIILDF